MPETYQKNLSDLIRFDFLVSEEYSSIVTINATLNGEVVGHAKILFETFDAHLTNIKVKRRYRSNGIGKKLLQQFIRYSDNKGYMMLMLNACPFEDASLTLPELIKFYESMGFKLKPLETNIMFLEI
jgi:ribosomal protein S18 acetylase RimI-like enzyme